MILHSGMTFRDLADYMFVPVRYVRERYEDLIAPPVAPKPPIPPRAYRPRRSYRRWQAQEIDALVQMREGGATYAEIGRVFQCGKNVACGQYQYWRNRRAKG